MRNWEHIKENLTYTPKNSGIVIADDGSSYPRHLTQDLPYWFLNDYLIETLIAVASNDQVKQKQALPTNPKPGVYNSKDSSDSRSPSAANSNGIKKTETEAPLKKFTRDVNAREDTNFLDIGALSIETRQVAEETSRLLSRARTTACGRWRERALYQPSRINKSWFFFVFVKNLQSNEWKTN